MAEDVTTGKKPDVTRREYKALKGLYRKPNMAALLKG
jgi:hypothetical protein